ncbi:DNA primase family protein [Sinirhodobacter huangdaonensis]|uniref:SF3 helicase domain-containing protein n=1 Tax=Paenirhodobacter huangdaonensis TaxID=2501515 RepID=A0A3S3M919_9RHOB|nr:phage/plasmid primase, P4 family [Sinirhodobacter huangdaonensis]RWR51577.1 hypothetical protein EOW66_11375 [Sinirhodobacter huangdaonensis]
MSRGGERNAPGAGKLTGGAEDRHRHHPDSASIPANGGPGDGEALSGDTAAALDFLRRWCPGGPWVLTSIVPDGGRTTTATFRGDERDRMAAWIEARQGRENVYFTVNTLRAAVTSKPRKLDVRAAHALHVDVDPREGENLDEERGRIQRMAEDWEVGGRKLTLPRPTVTIDSGGGYQMFWRLGEDVALPGEPGDEARHLPVEDRNRALGVALGGDDTQNTDRIMRLPGTVNVPGEKKRRKGRTARLAHVVDADWSRLYRLEDFEPAPMAGRGGAPRRNIAAAVGVDLEALGLPDRVKALIVNGEDPDQPGRWADRSDLVFHVLCEMVRADLPEEVMKAVILDPDHAVSAHVREQKEADAYADRQIARALAAQPRPGPVLHGGAMDWARALRDAGREHLRHHQQEFLDWDGAAYVAVPDDTVRAAAWAFLESCRVMDKDGKAQPFRPKPEVVSATIDALKAVTHLAPSREEPPRWLDGRAGPNPLDLLPTRSGLLHLPTGDLLPATPALFTRNAVDFAHDPGAPEPRRWLAFLGEVWPDADEADCVTALQEFMGYLLTPDTSLQKALLIPGPKRSGKGTIGRIMGKLVGEANTVAPSLNSFGRSDFGLEPLIAKQLAIVSDMRISNRTDEAAVAENLLRITGEDRVSVNRKHKKAVEVTLRARFVVMTNEVPRFADRSGALVSRFIVLPMRQSFFGREDPGLTGALMGELPGILNWAVEGWRRVRASGRITQPQAGRDVALQMGDLSSPIPAFVRDWCEAGPDLWVAKDRLFAAFREWHRDHMGQDYLSNSTVFARDLYSAMDGQVRDSKRGPQNDRVPAFAGIALRAGFRREDDTPF